MSWERRYCNSQAWLGLLQLGECCRAVLMSEAFSGLSESCLDRGAAQGLSKPVNIPPSEPPELPPSPLHTAKRRWITTTLERRYTFSALNRAAVRCSSASAGCLYRWVWSLKKDFSLCLESVYGMSEWKSEPSAGRFLAVWVIRYLCHIIQHIATSPDQSQSWQALALMVCHANKQSSQICWRVAEK